MDLEKNDSVKPLANTDANTTLNRSRLFFIFGGVISGLALIALLVFVVILNTPTIETINSNHENQLNVPSPSSPASVLFTTFSMEKMLHFVKKPAFWITALLVLVIVGLVVGFIVYKHRTNIEAENSEPMRVEEPQRRSRLTVIPIAVVLLGGLVFGLLYRSRSVKPTALKPNNEQQARLDKLYNSLQTLRRTLQKHSDLVSPPTTTRKIAGRVLPVAFSNESENMINNRLLAGSNSDDVELFVLKVEEEERPRRHQWVRLSEVKRLKNEIVIRHLEEYAKSSRIRIAQINGFESVEEMMELGN